MEGEPNEEQKGDDIQRIVRPVRGLRVIKASAEELVAHEARLDLVVKKRRPLFMASSSCFE